jgi:phosphomannomutase
VLLTLKTRAVVLSRSVDTIFEPLEEYERVGVVRNAVFSCGAVLRGDTLYIYYGGADTVHWRRQSLAESKQRVSAEMGELLSQLLEKMPIAVLSGAAFKQFETQFLPALPLETKLERLYLFPTNAAQCFVYREGAWAPQYDESFTPTEKEHIIAELKAALEEVHFEQPPQLWGEQIEDRGGQITFSALGQQAPVDEKKKWDPDRTKRKPIAEALIRRLPDVQVGTNATTSIDITRKGITKAHGIKRLAELANVSPNEILYIGDALGEGGNDSVVLETGVRPHEVFGPNETAEVIKSVIENHG